jgi:hypothetical protein
LRDHRCSGSLPGIPPVCAGYCAKDRQDDKTIQQ